MIFSKCSSLLDYQYLLPLHNSKEGSLSLTDLFLADVPCHSSLSSSGCAESFLPWLVWIVPLFGCLALVSSPSFYMCCPVNDGLGASMKVLFLSSPLSHSHWYYQSKKQSLSVLSLTKMHGQFSSPEVQGGRMVYRNQLEDRKSTWVQWMSIVLNIMLPYWKNPTQICFKLQTESYSIGCSFLWDTL